MSRATGDRRTIGRSAGRRTTCPARMPPSTERRSGATATAAAAAAVERRAGIGRNVCVALPLPTGRPAAVVRACFSSVPRSRPPCACLSFPSFCVVLRFRVVASRSEI